ncbi:hypothetical protein ACFLYW_01805 [Thermodesulfobacteriota bacterium]
MAVKRFFLYTFLALLVSGCASGHSVTETLHTPDSKSAQSVCATDKTVVLLPFADYSSGDDVMSVYDRSRSVSEALTDRFAGKGFKMPVQEDVTKYLVDAKIIRIAASNTTSRLEGELDGEWSDLMKGELQEWIDADKATHAARDSSGHPLTAPGVHGLDKTSISKLGRRFNADYVVRGRIIEYNLQKEHTWKLQKKGILPFIVGGTTQAAFGFAESDEYDNLNAIALWGLAGSILGYNLDTPFEPEKTTITVTPTTTTSVSTGDDNAEVWNAVTWGMAGGTMAHLVNHSGHTPEAIVHLRVWVQDTTTGDVVWTNRAEVKVAPESIYGDKRSRELFQTAVNRATTILVDDFWNKTKAVM